MEGVDPRRGARQPPSARMLAVVSIVTAAFVVAMYCVNAWALVRYPWDWSPDEGLFLDYARRLVEAPATLHGRSFVPFPSVYGPVLSALLAPAFFLPWPVLATARLLALAWTLLGAGACYLLVRREASPVVALAASALTLVPFDLTFWQMLIRPDGLHQTLWLLAATVLLPRALSARADYLSTSRLVLGTLLILAAVLTKTTAALLCAPLVLGWFVVDRRSALRLCLVLGLAGLAALSALEWVTAGGFLWVARAWGMHAWQASLPMTIVKVFTSKAWPVLVLCGVAAPVAAGRLSRIARDGAVLLVVGGLTMLPLTAKYGAWWHYLLPLLPGTVVLGARVWAGHGRTIAGLPPSRVAAATFSLIALALAATRAFPLPTRLDGAAAAAFYGFVERHVRERGGPILAVRPELAYFVVHQPVEMEGSGYMELVRGNAPGTELIPERLRRATYSLVIVAWPWQLPDEFMPILAGSYRVSGVCSLGYFFGPSLVTVLARLDSARPLPLLRGPRCAASSTELLETPGR